MRVKPRSRIACLTIAMLGLCWPPALLAEGAKLYRYRNDQGVLVIDHTVPAQAAERGYEILSARGQVLEEVAPARSGTAAGVEPAAPVASAQAIADQEKLDRYLLTSYSSVADIEAVKARRIEELDREVGIASTRLEDLARQRAGIEERAANLQRAGKAVPDTLIEELKGIESQTAIASAQLAERQLERDELAEHYDGYITRFTKLRELAESTPATTGPGPATATDPASAR